MNADRCQLRERLRLVRRLPSFLTALAVITCSAHAQNLLTNPGFESGLTGWGLLSGSVIVDPYGTSGVPSTQVANWIGGEGHVLRDAAAGGVVQQIVNTGPIPPNTRVRAGGFFGGLAHYTDRARLVVIFRDVASSEINRANLPDVAAEARNLETVLMRREAVLDAPPGTNSIAVRVELTDAWGNVSCGTADNIFLELTSDSTVPSPLPLNTELLRNPSFDQGWSSGSPLTLVDAQGWEGVSGQTVTKVYSNTDSTVPSATVSAIIGGGPRLAAQSTPTSSLKQVLDIGGNVALGAQLELQVSAYLGGFGGGDDPARVQTTFLDANGSPVGIQPAPIGPVNVVHRNYETVLLRREARQAVPAGTRYITIQLDFVDGWGNVTSALADRISAVLSTPTALQKLQLNTNAIRNGGFEQGSLPGSPLQLDDSNSWEGVQGSTAVLAYGISGSTPPTTFADMNQLGGLCLRGIGTASIAQRFSLLGYENAIAQGRMYVDAEAWLGGLLHYTDNADLIFWFKDENGFPVETTETIPAVTAADRNNTTELQHRSTSRRVPNFAKSFEVHLRFHDLWGNVNGALADGVRVSLRDTAQPGINYCTSKTNSSGAPALMSANGSNSLAANNLVLRSTPVPATVQGMFFRGLNAAQTPFGNGNVCVAGSILRFPIVTANSNGLLVMPVDYNVWSGTPLAAGDTWRFQAWFRDPSAGGSNFNLSDGYAITFVP